MDITLTITLKQNGEVGLNGPIENKILCLGLMEVARDLVIKYEPKAIQVAPASILASNG